MNEKEDKRLQILKEQFDKEGEKIGEDEEIFLSVLFQAVYKGLSYVAPHDEALRYADITLNNIIDILRIYSQTQRREVIKKILYEKAKKTVIKIITRHAEFQKQHDYVQWNRLVEEVMKVWE